MKLLQEPLITQRGGRYVLPLRAECKGSFKSIIHDQSASGGATLFVEPVAVVELNNEYRELELAERDEVLRVLRALTLRIAELHDSLLASTRAMAELDLILMKAKYAEELDAVEPVLITFDENPHRIIRAVAFVCDAPVIRFWTRKKLCPLTLKWTMKTSSSCSLVQTRVARPSP